MKRSHALWIVFTFVTFCLGSENAVQADDVKTLVCQSVSYTNLTIVGTLQTKPSSLLRWTVEVNFTTKILNPRGQMQRRQIRLPRAAEEARFVPEAKECEIGRSTSGGDRLRAFSAATSTIRTCRARADFAALIGIVRIEKDSVAERYGFEPQVPLGVFVEKKAAEPAGF
jgi:hypothetical protein